MPHRSHVSACCSLFSSSFSHFPRRFMLSRDFFFVIFRRLLFIDMPIKDDWGTLCMGKKVMRIVKWQTKYPCEFTTRISKDRNWQLYEPTKIYNSINRAKIINFSTPRPFPSLNCSSTYISHFFFPCFTFLIFSLDNPTDESWELPANLSSRQ